MMVARDRRAPGILVRYFFECYWVWRGWNAPKPMIDQSSNLVPTASAHRVATNTPLAL